jgi:hypothetical protein
MICTEIDGDLFSVGAQDSPRNDAGDRREILIVEDAWDSVPGFMLVLQFERSA